MRYRKEIASSVKYNFYRKTEGLLYEVYSHCKQFNRRPVQQIFAEELGKKRSGLSKNPARFILRRASGTRDGKYFPRNDCCQKYMSVLTGSKQWRTYAPFKL